MLRRTIATAIPALLALGAMTRASGATPSDWYAAFRARARVLLVFAPSEDDPMLIRQREALHPGSAGATARDIVVIEIIGDHADDARVNGALLREAYGVKKIAFTVILIGKDGTEKLRQIEPLAEPTLFATVDGMPMRQDEIARGQTIP